MEVSNPKRLLARYTALLDEYPVLFQLTTRQDLTGENDIPPSTSLAGTTHNLRLDTNYYKASIPVWLDLIASSAEWADSFLSDDAAEVLAVLGGLVVVLGLGPDTDVEKEELRTLIRDVGRVVDRLGGWEWDGVRLVVAFGHVGDEDEVDGWDELCVQTGFEFVHVDSDSRLPPARVIEDRERSGIARVKEALEANDWEYMAPSPTLSDPETDDDDDDDDEDEDLNLGLGKADLDALKQALWSAQEQEEGDSNRSQINDEDPSGEDLTKLEFMMRKLQAVRLAGSDMSDDQRRKVTAEAVAEVMRQL
ncbi:hypothetical protein L249_7702 [Ophiocordyceps polyrhachis-furcata BCC 54312]|uniref:Increased recombination centers protein 6 n=1 Tax=Ophiocordyceps polyrhachis-furcata BCC 54312 TaxID=1330021 RepID=A0A367LAG2_9HYPO|nr:hypothetical protein L249_7702 [Ophiocordyceps polyrhachis-furcata BCC 54312]